MTSPEFYPAKISLPQESVAAMGFPAMAPVSTLFSISHLFGASKKRCGIYLFIFQSGFYYVGQAVNVVRRFAQHRKIHDDIVGFSFIPVTKHDLDHTEKSLIFRAESLGLKITNVVHAANIVGETDFDLIMPIAEQDTWLASPNRVSSNEVEIQRVQLPEIQTIRFLKNYSRFEKHPLSNRALTLFKQYLWNCIPAPAHTEYSFWSVSCMPSSGGAWPRLLCVNAAVMELFVVGWERNNNTIIWSFINVAEDVLLEYWPSLLDLIS